MEEILITGPDRLTVQALRPEDEADAARVLSACDDYLVSATGATAMPADVQSLYYSLPEGAEFEQKHLLVLVHEDALVGLVDAVQDHPEPDTCSLGLFLLTPRARRRGLGTHAARLLLREAAARGIRRVTATCPESWEPGLAFLTALGFEIHAPEAEPSDTLGNRLRRPAEQRLCTAVRHLGEADGADGAARLSRDRTS
ncbi:GNAT family N-acetyltransferase [Streptomyces sp. NRRL WC-3725]|uniref:GNAT family N-acetyltransferase n=1 Tax=Streptomyces sp. NRRL WC-3725 TaxID=1463933 RepID=UPI0007C539BB|nr:GNAT family N-acetyltransferase [Streptomyces sp. NRRL WC-3725]